MANLASDYDLVCMAALRLFDPDARVQCRFMSGCRSGLDCYQLWLSPNCWRSVFISWLLYKWLLAVLTLTEVPCCVQASSCVLLLAKSSTDSDITKAS